MDQSTIPLQKETLESAGEYIKKVVVGIETIVDNFQSGREDIAFQMCADLIDGLKWLTEAITLTKDVQLKCDMDIDYSEVNETFTGLVKAFENSDYVLIGDLLEYELKPVMVKWSEKLDNLTGCEEFVKLA